MGVVICLKIRTFVVSATTEQWKQNQSNLLWFAWKFVPLWYQQQQEEYISLITPCCDLLENSYLCGISNNPLIFFDVRNWLWFAWKFVPLWYQQQLNSSWQVSLYCCDLLENSYLCGISNNFIAISRLPVLLWFAWKFVPLWYQQQLRPPMIEFLLSCDLLENSYLCGISNNSVTDKYLTIFVVICLKIRTFVVSATTVGRKGRHFAELWFAWKFVPLWYQQQLIIIAP